MMKLKHMRWTSWIGIFAILLTTFAPLISYALPQQADANLLQQICSAQGTKTIPLGDSSPAQQANHHERCPYCALHQPALVDSAQAAFIAHLPYSDVFASDSYTNPVLKPFIGKNHPPQAPPILHSFNQFSI